MRQLYNVALTQAFGRGGKRLYCVAYWRLAAALAAAIIAGHCIAMQFQAATIPIAAEPTLVFVFTCVAVQLCISLALVIALGVNQLHAQDTFGQLLVTLPLARRQRWLALQIPNIALSALTLALIVEPISILLSKLGLSVAATIAAYCVGTLSAFGMATGFGRWPIVGQLSAVGATFATEYNVLHTILRHVALRQAIGHSVIMLGIIGITLIGLIPSGIVGVNYRITRLRSARHIRGAWLPPILWPYKILIRSSTRVSILVNIVLSAGVVVAGTRLHTRINPTFGSFIAAVLAGSLTADVRGLFRQYRPAEIVTLRGSSRFVATTFFAACVVSTMSVFPLLHAILRGSGYMSWTSIASQLVLGVSVGFMASSLIVPATRDILGQFAAALLCFGVLSGLPLLPPLKSAPPGKLAIANVTIAAAFVCIAQAIELHRNNFIWRKYAPNVRK